MANAPESPRVEVAYALPGRQRVVSVVLHESMTALEAVMASGLLAEFPELAHRELPLGIYGRRVGSGQVLCNGDRVEIYRPLRFEPREARRLAVRTADRTRSSRPARRR